MLARERERLAKRCTPQTANDRQLLLQNRTALAPLGTEYRKHDPPHRTNMCQDPTPLDPLITSAVVIRICTGAFQTRGLSRSRSRRRSYVRSGRSADSTSGWLESAHPTYVHAGLERMSDRENYPQAGDHRGLGACSASSVSLRSRGFLRHLSRG